MTYNYLDQVATVGFSWKLLRQWRGSLQKAIWQDLLFFLTLFFSISFSYRCIITKESLVSLEVKEWFDGICVYCRESRKLVPISFLLGFYVTMVVDRWWEQLCCLASTEALAMHLACFIPGPGAAREVRRSIIRWACLSTVLTLRKVSDNILQRFPEYSHLVEAGMLTHAETLKLVKMDVKTKSKYCNQMHPIKWAKSMLRIAFAKGLIVGNNDNLLTSLSQDCSDIYDKNVRLLRYSNVPIPLLYTQVIIIAVYTYFLACVFGHQHLTGDHEGGDGVPDLYIPIFTILEFICYVGWLKVGSALINPFGDDDDDFDVDELIHRNLEMGFLLVEDDEMQMEEVQLSYHPNLEKPNILISADWWEKDWMLDIGREPLRIHSVTEANALEKEAVQFRLSDDQNNRLTVPRQSFEGVRSRGKSGSSEIEGSSSL